MSGRLRLTLRPTDTARNEAKESARMIIDEMTASVQRTLDYPGSISHHLLVVVQSETRIRSDMCARQINALLKRVSYAMDNPDVALRFINDEALLIDIGETGVDHEVMIKLST